MYYITIIVSPQLQLTREPVTQKISAIYRDQIELQADKTLAGKLFFKIWI
jgi:hypothetical protein